MNFRLTLNELRVSRMNCKPMACIIATMPAKRAIHDGKRRPFMPERAIHAKHGFAIHSKTKGNFAKLPFSFA
jgi:hypothetical protein